MWRYRWHISLFLHIDVDGIVSQDEINETFSLPDFSLSCLCWCWSLRLYCTCKVWRIYSRYVMSNTSQLYPMMRVYIIFIIFGTQDGLLLPSTNYRTLSPNNWNMSYKLRRFYFSFFLSFQEKPPSINCIFISNMCTSNFRNRCSPRVLRAYMGHYMPNHLTRATFRNPIIFNFHKTSPRGFSVA